MCACDKLQQINQYNNNAVHLFLIFGSNRLFQRIVSCKLPKLKKCCAHPPWNKTIISRAACV